MTTRHSVLVHSQNDELLMTLISALEGDYELTTVGEQDCLETVSNERPDVLLVDDMVNSPNCYEICQEIKNSALSDSTTVILVSDLDEKELEQEINLIGADDYVSTPIDPTHLKEKITTLLAFSLQLCS